MNLNFQQNQKFSCLPIQKDEKLPILWYIYIGKL
jgi:hypothetical protein